MGLMVEPAVGEAVGDVVALRWAVVNAAWWAGKPFFCHFRWSELQGVSRVVILTFAELTSSTICASGSSQCSDFCSICPKSLTTAVSPPTSRRIEDGSLAPKTLLSLLAWHTRL